jgi:DNA-binding GntR family transcriptional regulator
MAGAAPRSVARQPLGVTAYRRIYREIITLAYEPGQRLEEKWLMEHLGMGRTPIREALIRLAGEKLVASEPGRGFMVRPITLQNIKATFGAMKILEAGVADLTAQHDVSDHLEKMKEANREVKEAMTRGDLLGLVEANHVFHHYYARCSFNDYLVHYLNEIRSEAKRLSYMSYANDMDGGTSLEEHYRSVAREHADIIGHLRKKRTNALKKTVLTHISAFQRRILMFMST